MKTDQVEIIEFLKNNESAYPHPVSKIQLKETHISWILLTGKFAYKIKKATRFGNILNFSSLPLRRRYCLNEVAINKALCGRMYLGVVKIVPQKNGYQIVPLSSRFKASEYAVKMVEIPQKYRFDKLLIGNKVTSSMITKLAKKLCEFHKSAPTSSAIKRQGIPKQIQKKLDEDFATLFKLAKISSVYKRTLDSFLKRNEELFLYRIRQEKIRDTHGDLYLKNIFITKTRLYLYDRLEFNDILRYGDVCEDLAFLSMDLDFLGKNRIRKNLVNKYIRYSNDSDLSRLLPFYMCHKACIRAKVNFFFATNSKEPAARNAHLQTARKFLKLARTYFDCL
jgi:hypothetical protein